MAKKIKNGARKIVLEKAEEARIAAFSAFKSLGLNVPQFSQPLLLTTGDNPTGQEEATTFFRDDTSSSFVDPLKTNMVLAKPDKETDKNLEKVALQNAGETLRKTSNGGLVASVEVQLTTALQHNFVTENLEVPTVGSGTGGVKCNTNVDKIKNADTTLPIQSEKNCTGNITPSGHLDKLQDRPSQGLCLFKDSAWTKGPINATNTPGGFNHFLDIWEATQEFYFDIHYNKQSELNHGALFEIHGIAICWENSPVYYVNLPKDLLWSGNIKNDGLVISGSNDKSDSLPPERQLEIMKQRWKRIGLIMGKRDVRKFTWNLKVQNQVLKCAAVSTQRFGCRNLVGKSLGLELIDSLYSLSPIYVKDGIDLCIVAWILWPDEERSSNPNLEKVIICFIVANLG